VFPFSLIIRFTHHAAIMDVYIARGMPTKDVLANTDLYAVVCCERVKLRWTQQRKAQHQRNAGRSTRARTRVFQLWTLESWLTKHAPPFAERVFSEGNAVALNLPRIRTDATIHSQWPLAPSPTACWASQQDHVTSERSCDTSTIAV
jgi:hypothetical protein